MIRPTRRTVALFALSLPVAVVLLAAWPSGWYAVFYLPAAVLALLLADMRMTLPIGRLAVDTTAPVILFVGQRGAVEARLAVTEKGGRGGIDLLVGVEALLETAGDVEEPEPVRGVVGKAPLCLELPVVPVRRGRVLIAALWLRWRGPLGLAETRLRRPIDATVDIVPDVRGVHEAALQFFARDALYGVKAQRLQGEGAEFDKLREFAPGLDSRFMDWKRSARHRKLLCKEFRQERNHQIILGFDTGHLMLEPIDGMPKLDHAIRAGMLLGWVSLYGGDLVGGCGFDARFRHFIQPGRGMRYFNQIQRFAAGLDYRTEETNYTLGLAELNSRLGRRALVVVFSEFVDTISAELLLESLQLMARRHVVVFVTFRDPMLFSLRGARPGAFSDVAQAVLADGFLRERAIVLERVARLGVHCLDVTAGNLSTALLNRYLMIKQRGLL